MEFADRAARNEEIFRSINERIEQGAEQHGVETPLPFHCECGPASCLDTLELSPSVYERVVQERYRFVLIPGHEEVTIERVVERQPSYVVVERSVKRVSRSIAIIHSSGIRADTRTAPD